MLILFVAISSCTNKEAEVREVAVAETGAEKLDKKIRVWLYIYPPSENHFVRAFRPHELTNDIFADCQKSARWHEKNNGRKYVCTRLKSH